MFTPRKQGLIDEAMEMGLDPNAAQQMRTRGQILADLRGMSRMMLRKFVNAAKNAALYSNIEGGPLSEERVAEVTRKVLESPVPPEALNALYKEKEKLLTPYFLKTLKDLQQPKPSAPSLREITAISSESIASAPPLDQLTPSPFASAPPLHDSPFSSPPPPNNFDLGPMSPVPFDNAGIQQEIITWSQYFAGIKNIRPRKEWLTKQLKGELGLALATSLVQNVYEHKDTLYTEEGSINVTGWWQTIYETVTETVGNLFTAKTTTISLNAMKSITKFMLKQATRGMGIHDNKAVNFVGKIADVLTSQGVFTVAGSLAPMVLKPTAQRLEDMVSGMGNMKDKFVELFMNSKDESTDMPSLKKQSPAAQNDNAVGGGETCPVPDKQAPENQCTINPSEANVVDPSKVTALSKVPVTDDFTTRLRTWFTDWIDNYQPLGPDRATQHQVPSGLQTAFADDESKKTAFESLVDTVKTTLANEHQMGTNAHHQMWTNVFSVKQKNSEPSATDPEIPEKDTANVEQSANFVQPKGTDVQPPPATPEFKNAQGTTNNPTSQNTMTAEAYQPFKPQQGQRSIYADYGASMYNTGQKKDFSANNYKGGYDPVVEGRHDDGRATLRPYYGIAGPADVIPSGKQQLKSDIQFDMFSVVQPGFGEGVDNRLFQQQEWWHNYYTNLGRKFAPQEWLGPINYAHPMPWQWQSIKNTSDVEKFYAARRQEAKAALNLLKSMGEGSSSVLGKDTTEVPVSVSDSGLPRDAKCPLEPTYHNRMPFIPVALAPGAELQKRDWFRDFAPRRNPNIREREVDSGGPHRKKRRSLEVILP